MRSLLSFFQKINFNSLLLLCPALAGLLWITVLPSAQAISGGERVNKGDFPWFVAIGRYDKVIEPGWPVCGGALIDKQWVLTSIHCLKDLDAHSPKDIVMMLGAVDLFMLSESMLLGQAEKIIVYKDNEADLLLLKVAFSSDVSSSLLFPHPLRLPTEKAVIGDTLTIIGFGQQSLNPLHKPMFLNKLDSPVVGRDLQHCLAETTEKFSPDFMFCAGFTGTDKQAQPGDSGGPAVKQIDAEYILVGMLTSGALKHGFNNDSFPSNYVDVSPFVDWIKETIAAN